MSSLLDRLARYFGLRGDLTPPPKPPPQPAPTEPKRQYDLAALLANAQPVPLTDEVRLERRDFENALAEERSYSDGSDRARAAADELQRLIERAKPIPLTDQVRLDGRRARELLDQLRGAG
jgi:hypothetical protein